MNSNRDSGGDVRLLAYNVRRAKTATRNSSRLQARIVDVRLTQLDVLRAIAIGLVLVHHAGVSESAPALHAWAVSLRQVPLEIGELPALVVRTIEDMGWIGVDLFFVLSGFLVSGLLFREYKDHGDVWVGRFLIRRGLKIYPAFYCMLILTVLGISVFTVRAVNWWAVLSEALFIQNYGPNLWAHTWSLAVEEHFYLLIALLIFFLVGRSKSNPFRLLPGVFVCVATLELFLRGITSYAIPDLDVKIHMFPSHLRLDSLFFGAILSYYYYFEHDKIAMLSRHRRALILGAVLCIAPSVGGLHTYFVQTIGITLLYLGFGAVLIVALSLSQRPSPWQRLVGSPLALIGRHSYSIYLWHLAVLVIGVPLTTKALRLPTSALIELLIYLVGTIAVGIVMSKLVEMPFLRVRDAWFPSRGRPIAGQANDGMQSTVAATPTLRASRSLQTD